LYKTQTFSSPWLYLDYFLSLIIFADFALWYYFVLQSY